MIEEQKIIDIIKEEHKKLAAFIGIMFLLMFSSFLLIIHVYFL